MEKKNTTKNKSLIGNSRSEAESNFTKSTFFLKKYDYDQALGYTKKSLKLYEKEGNEIGIIRCLLRISNIFRSTGELNKALESVEKSLTLSEKIGNETWIANSLGMITHILMLQSDMDRALESAKKSLKLCEKLGDEILIANSLSSIARILRLHGDLDRALEYSNRCLALKHIRDTTKIYNLLNIGDIYRIKGEFDLALEYSNRGLVFAEENDVKNLIAQCLHQMGEIYWTLGKLDLALDHLKRCITLFEEEKSPDQVHHWGGVLFQLIRTTVDMGSIEQARFYLQRLGEHFNQFKIKNHFHLYRVGKAYILKTSSRTQDLGEATKLLKEVAEEEIVNHALTHIALVYLCDILLVELRITKNSDVLDEINPIITKLVTTAEAQHSYRWLAHVNLLQAKLALIQMDIEQARVYFTQAQNIASWHGFQRLARKISHEHDKLLRQLDEWENLKKEKAPLSKRMNLVSMDEIIEIFSQKRMVKPPELVDEIPVLLLVIIGGGIPVFSYSFTKEAMFEDNSILSSFLSAFNSFSEELFSKGLDRAKFGEYTIVMDSINNYSMCYLFKGSSYLAIQKLAKFSEEMQKIPFIWQTLEKFNNSNQVLELRDIPSLESIINAIFINKIPEMIG